MPWLPMYLDTTDLISLSSWLSNESEISLIKAIGEKQWQACNEFTINSSGRYCLYHRPSGPLPLLKKNWIGQDIMINTNLPYFGAGCPAIFWLNVSTENETEIGISSFEWIGNHYSVIGNSATDEAKKWWAKLRRWVKLQTTYIPRQGSTTDTRKEIYAFNSALNDIKLGMNRAKNP